MIALCERTHVGKDVVVNYLATTPLPRIIALCGRKQVGKDVVANYLATRYGYKNVKFAEPLKDALQALFKFTHTQIEIDKETIDPFWGVSPRQAMQFFGTEIMQFEINRLIPGIGRDFFVKSLLARHPTGPIVISDMRFTHEYNAIKRVAANDSIIIKIIKDTNDICDHISETELNSIKGDYTINNSGSIQELYEKVEKIINHAR